jgi:signal transduction histidine kinase
MVMRTSAAPNLDSREAGEPSNGVAVPVELDLPRRDDDDEWRPLLAGAVAHELRATLALISGYSQSLLHLPVDEATRRRYLERILSATEALAEFADQIMDVAGPGDVRPVLRRRPVALEWLASRLAREIASEPEQAPIRYQQTLDLPLVDVDPTWVGHVLRNLVRNALQHGAAGVVVVQARPLDGMVVVTVRDDGPGFEPDEYDLVFRPFYRGRRAYTSRRDGLGLGLYLCRELVEAHGGRIWIDETAEGGSISFSLPTVQSAQRIPDETGVHDALGLPLVAAVVPAF